jgi:quinol monooxygenase YgiN
MRETKLSDLEIERRGVLAGTVAMAALVTPIAASAGAPATYGLIGQMMASAGKRDELVAILVEGTGNMPGCLSYIVAKDAANPDALWITEVWTDAASHGASLKLPAVQAAITRARPIIAGFGQRFETVPVSGFQPTKT